MNSQDLTNHDIIKNLVDRHFGLEIKSLEYFYKKLEQRDIDEVYQEILGDSKDLRVRFRVDPNILEKFDEGWSVFKSYFTPFIVLTEMKYSDFRANRITIDGSVFKLEKALRNYYTRDEDTLNNFIDSWHGHHNAYVGYTLAEKTEIAASNLKKVLNEVGAYKLPLKENLELVFSLNFADWFLCSTGQSWTSCLNLDSDYSYCYWAGLPGLIGDKNRGMLYLTDGTKKEYRGIQTDSFTSRSWTFLDATNKIYLNKTYPKIYIKTQTIADLTGIKNLIDFETNYFSKHSIDFLWHENGFSSSVYLDYMGMSSSGNFSYKSTGGYRAVVKETGEVTRESCFNFSGGLIGLITAGSKITNVITVKCQECGNLINEGNEITYYDGEVIVCQGCSNRHQRTCVNCGESGLLHHQNWYEVNNGNGVVCEYCREDHYSYCSRCEKLIHNEDMINSGEHDGDPICSDCVEEDPELYICTDCEKYFFIENVGFEDEYNNSKTCKKCYNKFIKIKQPSLDFNSTQYIKIEPTVIVTKENVEYIL